MTKNGYHLDKTKLLGLLAESKKLVSLYDAENRKNPRVPYEHGGVDQVALRLLEGREGFVTIGIKLHGRDVKLVGAKGVMSHIGLVATDGTFEYMVENFEGTTASRFIATVCDVIDQRVDGRDPRFKDLMMDNAKAYTARTREEVKRYT